MRDGLRNLQSTVQNEMTRQGLTLNAVAAEHQAGRRTFQLGALRLRTAHVQKPASLLGVRARGPEAARSRVGAESWVRGWLLGSRERWRKGATSGGRHHQFLERVPKPSSYGSAAQTRTGVGCSAPGWTSDTVLRCCPRLLALPPRLPPPHLLKRLRFSQNLSETALLVAF